MKLKLDENLSRHLKPVLFGLGHDVLTAADENLLSHPGVILFRPLSLSPLSVNAFITDFVRRTDLDKLATCVAVVDPVHARVRYPLKAPE